MAGVNENTLKSKKLKITYQAILEICPGICNNAFIQQFSDSHKQNSLQYTLPLPFSLLIRYEDRVESLDDVQFLTLI